MYIYIANIILSTLFFKMSEQLKSKASLILAFVIPCLVAGLRDTWIGTDIAVYAADIYWRASSTPSFIHLLGQFPNQPPGFLLLSWIVSRVGINYFWLYLAILQSFCIVPVYITLKNLAVDKIWLGMCAYLILIFPPSLNMMKQCISVSFIFLSMIFIKKRNLPFFATTILVASSMHQTAIMFAVIYPIYSFINSSKVDIIVKYFSLLAISILFVLILIIFRRDFISLLADSRDTYTYIADRMNSSTFRQTNILILIYMIIVHFFFIRESYYKNSSIKALFFTSEYFAILGWCAEFLSLIAAGLSRIGLYGQVFSCLYLILISKILPKKTALVLQILYLLLILFCSFHLIINGQNQIYPYSSRLLGI